MFVCELKGLEMRLENTLMLYCGLIKKYIIKSKWYISGR